MTLKFQLEALTGKTIRIHCYRTEVDPFWYKSKSLTKPYEIEQATVMLTMTEDGYQF